MIVNQQNLHGLNVAYSTAYNKAFQGRKTQYERIATVVPSTTASINGSDRCRRCESGSEKERFSHFQLTTILLEIRSLK